MNSPRCASSASARSSASGKSTTACSSSTSRYSSRAMRNSFHTPRVSTAFRSRRKAPQVVAQPVGQRGGGRAVRLERAAVQPVVGLVGRPLLARRAVLREEVVVDAVDEQPNPARLTCLTRARRSLAGARHRPTPSGRRLANKRYRGCRTGPVARKRSSPPSTPPSVATSRAMASRGDPFRRQLAWRRPHGAIENRAGHEPPIEQPGQARPQLQVTQFGKHHRDGRVLARHGAADAQRAVQRLVGQAQRFGLVGHAESGVEPGLERKLAQQRQAERVDGADGDVRTGAPAASAIGAGRCRPARPTRLSVARMRSRISAAALRVKVMARMCRGSTPARTRLT